MADFYLVPRGTARCITCLTIVSIKHYFTYPKTDFVPLKLTGFRREISTKLLPIHGNFLNSFHQRHLYPLQVENCDSNSRLVVDEDDNGKFRFERVNL